MSAERSVDLFEARGAVFALALMAMSSLGLLGCKREANQPAAFAGAGGAATLHGGAYGGSGTGLAGVAAPGQSGSGSQMLAGAGAAGLGSGGIGGGGAGSSG